MLSAQDLLDSCIHRQISITDADGTRSSHDVENGCSPRGSSLAVDALPSDALRASVHEPCTPCSGDEVCDGGMCESGICESAELPEP